MWICDKDSLRYLPNQAPAYFSNDRKMHNCLPVNIVHNPDNFNVCKLADDDIQHIPDQIFQRHSQVFAVIQIAKYKNVNPLSLEQLFDHGSRMPEYIAKVF